MMITRRAAALARHNGSTAAETIAEFHTPWQAVAYAELECPGTGRYERRLCVVLGGFVYPFVVREDGESVFRAEVYEALQAACPRD